ncbi:MAG TPA: hypothetical protein VFA93_02765 [Patescibacteria group bacterium]|nr:hypothetical protein [Patescibacteria group bacterium]
MKELLRKRAINLRRKGLSYSEILQKIPVAKSTLSLWLRSIGLSKKQEQKLTEKKLLAIQKGGQSRKNWRLATTRVIKKQAYLEIKKRVKRIDTRDLWLIGIMLYWAEGAKDKEYSPGQSVIFSNSDPLMIKVFLKWIDICLQIPVEDMQFSIYIHENHKHNIEKVKKFWSDATGFSIGRFDKIYYKKHKVKVYRRNVEKTYHGLLRIRIRKSSALNRRITGWIEGICKYCRVV